MKSIRQLLREGLLKESMDIFIPDYDNSENFNTLSDVKSYIYYHTANYITELVGEDKYNEYREYGFFEYDGGSSPYEATGVINFYIWKMPEKLAKHCCEFIFNLMKEKGIGVKFSGPEESGSVRSKVIRLNVFHNPVNMDTPPDLNMSNNNMFYFFTEILRYSKQEFQDQHHFPVDDILTRTEFALDNLGLTDYDSAPKMHKAGNVTHHTQGYNQEDAKRRLEILKDICLFAKKNNHKTIAVA